MLFCSNYVNLYRLKTNTLLKDFVSKIFIEFFYQYLNLKKKTCRCKTNNNNKRESF